MTGQAKCAACERPLNCEEKGLRVCEQCFFSGWFIAWVDEREQLYAARGGAERSPTDEELAAWRKAMKEAWR